MSPQPLLRVVSNSSYSIFSIFCPICPYMEIRSQTPGILKFFKFSDFIRSALLVRFQRALNHTPKFFLTQVIPSFLYFKNTIVWLVAYFENKISTLFLICSASRELASLALASASQKENTLHMALKIRLSY